VKRRTEWVVSLIEITPFDFILAHKDRGCVSSMVLQSENSKFRLLENMLLMISETTLVSADCLISQPEPDQKQLSDKY
jgi:hypothetical protein